MEDFKEDYSKSPSHVLLQRKSKEDFQREIDYYNIRIQEVYRYKELQLAVKNHSNIPYTNIDIYLEIQ